MGYYLNNMQDEIVTLDGPAGAGKSTVAKLVAKTLGFKYLDTGATYRVVTLAVIGNSISLEDDEALRSLLSEIKITFDDDGGVLLNGEVVSSEIRNKDVTSFVSRVAALDVVRDSMVSLQRGIAKDGTYVLDGRDTGSVVLPNAKYKFYLDANVAERAMRRYREDMNNEKGTTLEEIKASIEARDKYDKERSISPLVVPDAATVIDTSFMSINEVVTEIVMKVNFLKYKSDI